RPGKLLVCATNFVETIDPAVLRPGRFDLLIGIGPPDLDALRALWAQSLGGMNVHSEVDIESIAERCIGFTPGDVDLAAQRAASLAFSRARHGGDAVVTAADIDDAVERTSPSVTREMYDTFRAEVAAFERI
ncbi:MAG: AAA family ATPase, partial [Ilumatobacteraceae bacterium]